ncbi:MAG: AAA family ATPase [Candidatus Pacearchaeota archaeon]
MKLKKIVLNNIRTYEKQEITFPKGSVLLSGDIGSGKSTILLALEFALFGLQTGCLSGASLLRNGADSGSVEIELEIDGKPIRIKRGLKRSKKSVTQEKGLFVMENNEEELGAEELKQRVLDIFGYPMSLIKARTNLLYRFTVYTPQEEMKQILLENADDRIDVIRKIFGIDKYKKITANTDLIAARIREEARFKESRILDLPSLKEQKTEREQELNEEKARLKEILSKYESLKKEVELSEQESDKILAQITKVNELKLKLASLLSELKLRENELEETDEAIKENEAQLKELKAKIDSKTLSLENFSEKIRQKIQTHKALFDAAKKIGSKIGALELSKAELLKTKHQIDSLDQCPICKQKVTAEHKCKITEENTKKLEEIARNIAELEKDSAAKSKELEKIESEIESLREQDKESEKIKLLVSSINEKANIIERLKKKSTEVQEKIIALKNQKEGIEQELMEFKDIDALALAIKQKLNILRKEERDTEIEKVKHERNLENAQKIIELLDKDIAKKERVSLEIAKLKKLNEWLTKHYMEIIAKIEKTVMAKLNKEFNSLFETWFKLLVESLEARVDENFTPIIEQQGYDIDYVALSGGERTAAALAYRLALNQIINHFMGRLKTKGLLILDEPTDGFSSEQLEKMKNIMSELDFEQLILVSHESEVEDFVENVINFEKKEGVTRVY